MASYLSSCLAAQEAEQRAITSGPASASGHSLCRSILVDEGSMPRSIAPASQLRRNTPFPLRKRQGALQTGEGWVRGRSKMPSTANQVSV